MNRTLFAKRADLLIQFAAFLIPVVWGMIARDGAIGFCAYLSVGLVQVLSCLINKFSLPHTLKSRQRRSYEKMLLVVSVIGVIMIAGTYCKLEIILMLDVFYGFAMLLIGAGMGIWYSAITAEELGAVRKSAIQN